MPRVDEETDVGELERTLDLRSRLAERRRVRVQGRLEARARAPRRVRCRRASAPSPSRRARPPAPGFATRSGEPPSPNTGRASLACGLEEVERPGEPFESSSRCSGSLKERAPAARQREARAPRACAQLVPRRGTRRPELGALVTGRGHLCEQLVRARNVRVRRRSPRRRRTTAARSRLSRRHQRHARVFGSSAHVSRIHASAGSSLAAIEWWSPASAFR